MGNSVIITGASGGIGKAIALQLAEAGYNLTLCYNTNKGAAMDLSTRCTAFGVKCLCIKCDLSDLTAVDNMINCTVDEFGTIDGLVNNAGISHWGLFTDMTEEEWDHIFAVNVKSMFLTSKYVLPHMIHNHSGRIINISSMWGQVGASCEVAYSATKGAIISMTKALAKEVGPSGITVNCIAPGVIDTPMNASFTTETISQLKDETPVGRIGAPEDVASVVKYLISPEASFITGQIIGVNGGFVI